MARMYAAGLCGYWDETLEVSLDNHNVRRSYVKRVRQPEGRPANEKITFSGLVRL